MKEFISAECYDGNHHLCTSTLCECGCHTAYPDTGESGETYDKEIVVTDEIQ